MKTLDTLVEDIYGLFDPDTDHNCNEENLDAFANNIKDLVRSRLKRYTPPSSPLRFSSLGKKNRQLWYEAHPEAGSKEALLPKTYLKFMYGDVIEQLLLLLVKEAGHTVEQEQATVVVDGVEGHIDAIIDGVVVDVKSASPYGFKKFEQNTVLQDDDFGYVEQLAGYSNVLAPGKDAAWLAMDKVGGDIAVSILPETVIRHYQPEERINELREVIQKDQPPERCYEDVPDGASGNRKLVSGCSYCAHKFRCWPGLRAFAYSNGPRYLTHVAVLPKVPEITPNNDYEG